MRWYSGLVVAFLASHIALGQDPLEARIKESLEQGVSTLKKTQGADGSWGQGNQAVGLTALCAWALLETGVPKDDAAMGKALDYLRQHCLTQDFSYSVMLPIIFLDRFGDPGDGPLIEALVAQVLASHQTRAGGWTYDFIALTAEEQQQVRSRVKALRERASKSKDEKVPPKIGVETTKLIGDLRSRIQDLGACDNSNSQFAIMALWVGRRHGMPVDELLARAELDFRKFQDTTGKWPYNPTGDVTPAMTCAGLLALAIGNGVKKDKGKNLADDPAVKKGWQALTQIVDEMSAKKDRFFDDQHSYYFLWSLERMAVIYDVKKVGDRDWYRWGAELLVRTHPRPGDWQGAFGVADTSFAILFLKKANVAKDLTEMKFFNPLEKQPPRKPPQRRQSRGPVSMSSASIATSEWLAPSRVLVVRRSGS